jgi:uncharacterized membrane protein
MSTLGAVHLTAAIASLGLGAAVLLISPKGTRLHRRVGWAYALSMLALNVTALMIYRLFGVWGPFHWAAIVSLLTIVVGVAMGRRAKLSRLNRDRPARPRFVQAHYYSMTWSYVGLAAAAISEIATRLPATRPRPGGESAFWTAVGLGTFVVVVAGAWLIRAQGRKQVAAVGAG